MKRQNNFEEELASKRPHYNIDPNLINSFRNYYYSNNGIYFHTKLTAAVDYGNLEIINYLIDTGENIDEINSQGYSPLKRATEMGKSYIAKFLIDKGANFNIKDYAGNDILLLAALRRNIEIVEYLLDKGANPNSINLKEQTPLKIAILLGSFDMVNLLLKKGADVNLKDSGGVTPLHLAFTILDRDPSKTFEIVKLLLDHGASPLAETASGDTPINWAYNALFNSPNSPYFEDKSFKLLLDKAEVDAYTYPGHHLILFNYALILNAKNLYIDVNDPIFLILENLSNVIDILDLSKRWLLSENKLVGAISANYNSQNFPSPNIILSLFNKNEDIFKLECAELYSDLMFQYAIKKQNINLLKNLLADGNKLNQINFNKCLVTEVKDIELTTLLIKNGLSLSNQAYWFKHLISKNQLSQAQMLLDAGLNIYKVAHETYDYESCESIWMHVDQPLTASWLLKKGAPVFYGELLMIEIPEIAELFLEHGHNILNELDLEDENSNCLLISKLRNGSYWTSFMSWIAAGIDLDKLKAVSNFEDEKEIDAYIFTIINQANKLEAFYLNPEEFAKGQQENLDLKYYSYLIDELQDREIDYEPEDFFVYRLKSKLIKLGLVKSFGDYIDNAKKIFEASNSVLFTKIMKMLVEQLDNCKNYEANIIHFINDKISTVPLWETLKLEQDFKNSGMENVSCVNKETIDFYAAHPSCTALLNKYKEKTITANEIELLIKTLKDHTGEYLGLLDEDNSSFSLARLVIKEPEIIKPCLEGILSCPLPKTIKSMIEESLKLPETRPGRTLIEKYIQLEEKTSCKVELQENLSINREANYHLPIETTNELSLEILGNLDFSANLNTI